MIVIVIDRGYASIQNPIIFVSNSPFEDACQEFYKELCKSKTSFWSEKDINWEFLHDEILDGHITCYRDAKVITDGQ